MAKDNQTTSQTELATVAGAAAVGAFVPLFLTQSDSWGEMGAKAFLGALVGGTLAGAVVLFEPHDQPKNTNKA